MSRRPLVLFAAVALAAILALQPAPASEWEAPHLQDHPLVGRIWSVEQARSLSREDLRRHLQGAAYVLLGEVHDNPDHHRLHGEVLQWLARGAGEGPGVAFEIFDREQQPRIERMRAEGVREAERLGQELEVAARHWPWPLYRPLVQWVLDHDRPLAAANLSAPRAARIAREGAEAVLGAEPVHRLGLDRPLPAAAGRQLVQDIQEAHCGYLPTHRVGGMVQAQRARDAVMAQSLQTLAVRPAVLIAGNGHVRRDYGVPFYLPGDGVLSVGFLEVSEDRRRMADYGDTLQGRYDIVWFTPRVRVTDPCEAFRQQLEGMGQEPGG
ncbi:ChaN family lipoprotein [Ectothiorhodospira mobilis]|uniref:ChaN family lipoprotein n=1 Tax=Ectothiorhodospira mobilis TaxID=195064 RepID=UPI001EE8F500|nr:ChaN family lipoprotein [Ectothiorhodospira mobilis]MCG5536669.1 ChaN family lipoprotein [Ectothiorhodospira mobilis]